MAISANTNIPTKYGFVEARELKVGDIVYDIDGHETEVIQCKEIDIPITININFGRNTRLTVSPLQIMAGYVSTRYEDRLQEKLVEFLPAIHMFDMATTGRNMRFPLVTVIGSGRFNIDPWLFGFWLGDGSKRNTSLATSIDDIEDIKANIIQRGYEIGAIRYDKRANMKGVSVNVVGGFKQQLRQIGVIMNKHIPSFFYGLSKDYRLEMMQGLIDSDGTIDRQRGRVIFTNTNYDLAIGCARLASSLGELVSIYPQEGFGFGKGVQFYNVIWTPQNVPVLLPRKRRKVRIRQVLEHRTTHNISLNFCDSGHTRGYDVKTKAGTMIITDFYIPIGTGVRPEINGETANKILKEHCTKRIFSNDKQELENAVNTVSPIPYRIQKVRKRHWNNAKQKKHIIIDGRLYKGIISAAKVVGCSCHTIERAIKKGSGEVWGHSIGLKD